MEHTPVDNKKEEANSKESKPKDSKRNNDTIQIPVGRWFYGMRENPWIASTIVLAIFFIVILVSAWGGPATVSGEVAAAKAIAFLNSNPQLEGEVTLVSVEQSGSFYEVVVAFQGEQVPIYVTLDGEFLVTGAPISLEGFDLGGGGTGGGGTPPNQATPEQLSEDDDAVLGDANAPVTIIEFSDYQCPFCRKFWTETLPSIKENYIDTGKAKLVYRDYPLPSHAAAQKSAEAAECVREQGGDEAYFEMHDKMFEEQNIIDSGSPNGPVQGTATYSVSDLKSWAGEIGYNIDSCLDSGKYASEVQSDLQDGGNLGTPTFFINGAKIEGAQPYGVFEQTIENALLNA